METLVFILEIIGTIAFAASGAMVGINKKMDIFGVCILGLTVSVGGGIIRDLILGNTPPNTFQNPVYALVAIGVSIIVFIPKVRNLLKKIPRGYDMTMRIMDAVGLGIFTVIGAQVACVALGHADWLTIAFFGTITGVGGGVLRDVMAGDMPYIFRKHIYALASLAGALHALWQGFAPEDALRLSMACGVANAMLGEVGSVHVEDVCAMKEKIDVSRI